MPRGLRKYPGEEKHLFFSRMDMDAIELRRAFAQKMRDEGYTQFEIAAELGIKRSSVLKLLMTREQLTKIYQAKAAYQKRKRKTDKEYAEKSRTYMRRYAQSRLKEAREGGRQYQNSVVEQK